MPAQVLGREKKEVTFPDMRFFFLPEAPPTSLGLWTPPVDLMKHLRALRCGDGVEFLLLDLEQNAWLAKTSGRAQIELLGDTQPPSHKLHRIELATAWPKQKRAEELMIRACESGVAVIQPILYERSIFGRDPLSKKQLARLKKLARECCQQLGNVQLPEIRSQPISLAKWLEQSSSSTRICLRPGASALSDLWSGLKTEAIEFLVGPEGGFTDDEIQATDAAKIQAAGLSPNILRIEAAGPMAAGICQNLALSRMRHHP